MRKLFLHRPGGARRVQSRSRGDEQRDDGHGLDVDDLCDERYGDDDRAGRGQRDGRRDADRYELDTRHADDDNRAGSFTDGDDGDGAEDGHDHDEGDYQ